ncbi:putative membrane protein [Shimia abyssi]|uniref:Putative membrane protein n=2 Tax=Shimia abyssi TaxID=1662395 RepID=A0A2P8FB64_9RHOB|nr:putative membrane protein [Shimia abyssi]
MVLMAFTLGTIPLYGLLGTVLLWGILPFILIVVGGLWWGLERSYRDGDILEELSLSDDILTLRHRPPKGDPKTWECNIYWARVEMHVTGGPVPHYVTLSGNGRTVEIGSFLSEDERKSLYGELTDFLKSHTTP